VRTCVGIEGRSGALPGWVLEDPSGTPQKGGSGPPKKGGCRDTKQCKFWRVSSVLIQGAFCLWGVRGVPGGSREGSFWGVRVAAKDGVRDLKNGPSGALPLHPSVRNQNQDGDGCGRRTCGATSRRQDVGEVWTGGVRHDAGRVTQQQWHDGGPATKFCESSGSVHGMEGPRCVILTSTKSSLAPERLEFRACLMEVATLWTCTHNFRRGVELNRRTQKTRV
jgi:hypothetical protein